MEYVHHLLPVLVPSMITVLVILIFTILHNARRTLLIRKENNIHQKAEKIPQENDERFATGKSFIIYMFSDIAMIINIYVMHLVSLPDLGCPVRVT